MPLIVDLVNDTSNGVGTTFRTINLILAVVSTVSAFLITLLWLLRNGFSSCF